MTGPSAVSVDERGNEDGWAPAPGWRADREPSGPTRLVVSVPPVDLPEIHRRLVRVLDEPLGVLYRQRIDRRRPRPQGAPPRDFVAMNLTSNVVLAAVEASAGVLYHDARCELWVRGRRGDQVVLDADGVLFCYPDDHAFREAVAYLGEPNPELITLGERDYVKHWYHACHDASEDTLLHALSLIEAPRS